MEQNVIMSCGMAKHQNQQQRHTSVGWYPEPSDSAMQFGFVIRTVSGVTNAINLAHGFASGFQPSLE
jgi:hypothetical protein